MQEKPGHHHTLTHLWRSCFRTRMHSNRTCAILVQWTLRSSSTMAGGKNEDDSAVLFSNFAQEVNLEPAKLAKVFRWIVLTKHHRCDESDDNYCKFFMNFDMAVLGWELAASARHAQDVRKEFIHVPEGQREGCWGTHNGQTTPPNVGVIMIIIQNGQSLLCSMEGRPKVGRRPVLSVPQSVSPSTLCSSLFTLHATLPTFLS